VANITITIPDALVPRVVTALCSSVMTDAVTFANPTPALAKQVLVDYIKERVRAFEEEQARKAIVVDVSNIAS
jgi:hypothetical protein